jgi:hypothetical protein
VASLASRPNSAREITIVPIEDVSRVPAAFLIEVDQQIPDRVVCFFEGGGGAGEGRPVLRRPLRDDERAALEKRRADLLRTLAPPASGRHGDRAPAAIAGMLAAFPAMSRHDMKAGAAMVAGYLSTVRDLPPWAVIAACGKVRAGEASLDRDFCPSEPAFCATVRGIVAPYEAALQKVSRLLGAEPPRPPEHREPDAPKKVASPPDRGHARRALDDLAWRKVRREPPAPSVFELDPETWDQ